MNTDYHVQLLKNTIAETRSKFFSLNAEQRKFKPSPDKWSKKEILGHLIDSARYNLQRFSEIIITEGIYSVKSYDQTNLVRINDYQNVDDFELFILWQVLNKRIIHILGTIKEGHLNKQIISGNEPFTLAWLINDYMVHLQHHLNQIFHEEIHGSVPSNVTLSEALEKWKKHFKTTNSEFVSLFRFADLEVEYYKPQVIDKQKPHPKDEIYVIASGSGKFFIEGEIVAFSIGDVLYAKAGDEHRFFEFTEDFATWVIFYGVQNDLQ